MQQGQGQDQACEASPTCWLRQRRQAFGVSFARLAERWRLFVAGAQAPCAAGTFCPRLVAL
eukprot:3441260-Pyramimonas_sp.AAC.1